MENAFKYKFEGLEVWKLGLDVLQEANRIAKTFPSDERFILTSQMRRAALSVALNVAEGSGRSTKADFRRFIRNAIGSALETIGCLKIAIRLSYIEERECEILDSLLRELYFKLIKFDKYLKE